MDVERIDGVYVSTDDNEIAQVVESISSDIGIVERPANLATDDASTESVMLHFAEKVNFDVLITAQATSPLTTSFDFRKGLNLFFEGDYDSLLTGVREKRFYWIGEEDTASPVNYDYKERPRRQEFEGWIMENGAFYITTRELLIEEECRLGGRIGILGMDPKTAIEIDEQADWQDVESLLMDRKRNVILENIPVIRLLVVDVDGTLTDAGMYYSEEGEMLKKFNTRDAKGLELVRNQGIEVAIMTSEDSNIVRARAEKLKIDHLFSGIKNKAPELKKLCERLSIEMTEVAYIGDDLNDLSCMKLVGLGCCPSDALPEVKKNSGYICRNKGGKGAVREVCDLLLLNRMSQD